MLRPYVSLSALATPSDVERIQQAHTQGLVLPTSHDLLLGVSIDRDTVAGKLPANPRKLDTIAALAQMAAATRDNTLLAVHVECYFRNQDPKEQKSVSDFARYRTAPFADDVLRALEATDMQRVGALQLNGVVDADELQKVHERHPRLPIIYQLRRELLQRGTDDIRVHLQQCRHAIAHVLLDLSSGAGVPLKKEECDELMRIVSQEVPDARIGIAGGISAQNVADMYAMTQGGATDVSLDTETAIRTVDDAFSVDLSIEFLAAAYAAIAKRYSATHS